MSIICERCGKGIKEQAYIRDNKTFCSEECRENYKVETIIEIKIISKKHIKCGCGHPITSHRYDSAGWNCSAHNCSCPMTPGEIVKELYNKQKIDIK